MKTTAVLSALVALALAAPSNMHAHQHLHDKRVVVWKTDIIRKVVTIDVTETVTLGPDHKPTPMVLNINNAGASEEELPAPAAAAPAQVTPPAAPAAPASPPPAPAAAVAAPPPPPPQQPAAPPAAPAAAPPAKAPAPAAAPAAPAAAPAAAPPALAPAAPPAAKSDSSSGAAFLQALPGATVIGDCTASSPCGTVKDPSSHATYYTIAGGITACGNTAPETDHFVAVTSAMMGSLSSGSQMNPMCGKQVHITNTATGKSTTATVMDKCPGCPGTSGLDMSEGVFSALGVDLGQGTFPLSWYFM